MSAVGILALQGGEDVNPQQYCHKICKKSGSNFVYSFYCLGKKRRLAMEAFYAFCRVVDDSVDQASDLKLANQKLKFWREEIPRLYEDSPRHLISQALSPVVKDYQIPKKYLEEIVAGCEMDLVKKTYATFEELETYCYKVASCVGLVCLHIFGVPLIAGTQKGAIALGKALQITNILRDIVTDLRRERIYIPQEDLKKFGVTITDLSGRPKDDLNLVDLLYFEIERARPFFKEAWRSFPNNPKENRKLLPATLMGRFYEAIFNKISRDPMRIFREKVRLTLGEKLKITAKTLADAYLK